MVVNSARDLAHDINDGLKLGLTPRPWNLFSPADTFWWLVPSTDWPAYRYGKLAFSLAKGVPRRHLLGLNDAAIEVDTIFAGFNVEKRYGGSRPSSIQVCNSLWLLAAGSAITVAALLVAFTTGEAGTVRWALIATGFGMGPSSPRRWAWRR